MLIKSPTFCCEFCDSCTSSRCLANFESCYSRFLRDLKFILAAKLNFPLHQAEFPTIVS